MHYNIFGTQFEFQIIFNAFVHITGLFFKAYQTELIYSRKLAFGKNRKVEVEWVIGKSDQICFFKSEQFTFKWSFPSIILNFTSYLPVLYIYPVSYPWILQLFLIALCYLASNISFVFCMIRPNDSKIQCMCLSGYFFPSKWFTNWHPLILSLVLFWGPSYPCVWCSVRERRKFCFLGSYLILDYNN